MKYFNHRQMLVIGMLAATYATAAFSQDVTSTVRSEPNPRLKRNAIEIRPVESLISATPGLASGGASFETYIGRNWTINVGGTYADVNLPQKYVRAVNTQIDQPMVSSGYGYEVGTGVRYYNDPIGNSIYGGMNVDYGESRVGWEYNSEVLRSNQIAVTPSLTAGYRWVWQNGFLARLGAGVGLPSIVSQQVIEETSGTDAAIGARKVSNALSEPVVAKLDMGLGMMF